MARKDESLLNLLTRLPWQVSVVVAAVAYVLLRFVLPAIPVENPVVQSVLQGVSKAAPLIVLVLLAAGIVSVGRSWQRRRLLDRQTGLDSVGKLSWQEFEALVGEAFLRKGYRVLENPGAGPDGGVDLRLRKDGRKVFVQCKHWKKRDVGVKPVRELYGVMKAGGADEGIVVTYGDFTREARAFARGKPLELVGGEALARLLRDARRAEGAARKASSLPAAASPVREAVASSAPGKKRCPECGSDMVLRKARKGAHAGERFWGCSRYPRCRGILPYGNE
jgi:restriction system protein